MQVSQSQFDKKFMSNVEDLKGIRYLNLKKLISTILYVWELSNKHIQILEEYYIDTNTTPSYGICNRIIDLPPKKKKQE